MPSSFRVIAHRGASAEAPENSLPAFERALAVGAEEVELDIQLSRDDVLVLFHDSTLDAKTRLAGRVRDHDADALARADIGSWFDAEHPTASQRFAGTGLLRLDALFDRFAREFVYHVEIKAPEVEIPERLISLVRERGLIDRVVVSSFRWDSLERAHALDSELSLCALVRARGRRAPAGELSSAQREAVDRAHSAGFDQVAIAVEDLSPALIDYVRSRGLGIRAWRIKSDADLARAVALGVDGATTNWPERALRE